MSGAARRIPALLRRGGRSPAASGPGGSAPAFAAAPAIDGVSVEYATLTVVPGTVTGTEPISRSYRWLMDGIEVGTGTTYVVTAADAGAVPTVEETATNAFGSAVDESAGLLPVWRPSELGSRLRGWIDAAEVTLVGSDIDAFDDLAGVGNVFVAPAAANRPAQTANFNSSGRPCATFSGSDEYVTETTFDWGQSPLSDGATEVFITRLVTNLSGNRYCVYGTTNLGLRETSSFRLQWRGTTTTALNQAVNASQTPVVVTGEWNGPTGDYQIATGGLAVVTGTQTAGATLTNNLQMWVGGTNVTADSNCEIAEALFVRGVLSDLELAQVEAYARAKFGVPAIVQPAFTTAPSFTGKPIVGATLTAVSGTRTGATGLTITDSYRWFVDGVQVATGATYVVQPADEGGLVTLRQRASNSMGFADSAESAAVLVVQNDTLGIGGFTIANYYERSGTLEPIRTGDVTHIAVFQQTATFGSSQQTISAQNNSYGASAPGWYFWQDGATAYGYVAGCGNANGVVTASRTAEDIGKAHAMGLVYGPTDDTAQAISDGLPGDWLTFTGYTAPATSVPRRMGLLGSTANPLTAGRYLGEIVIDGLFAGEDLIAWWRECRLAGRVVAPSGYTLLEHVDVTTDLAAGAAPASFSPSVGGDFTLVGSLTVSSVVEGLTWDMPAGIISAPMTPPASAPASPSWTGTVKVMMAGDSLVAGVPSQPNGPRQQIYDRLTAEGSVDFVGSQSPPGGTVPDNECSAVAGNTTDQIFDRLDADVVTYTPDVLSVGFGANDFGGAAELDVALRRAKTSLEAYRAAYPDMIIVIHEHGPWSTTVPFAGSTRNGNRCRTAWNDCMRRLATDLGGPTYVAAVADAYTSADLIDNIHPDSTGNVLMGDVISDAILTGINGGSF